MKKTIALIALFACAYAFAQTVLLSSVTVTGAGTATAPVFTGGAKTFQASATTTAGTGTAVVSAQCSLDGTNWDTLGTISLSVGTVTTSNSFASNDRCRLLRGNVTSISGTGTAVILNMGQ